MASLREGDDAANRDSRSKGDQTLALQVKQTYQDDHASRHSRWKGDQTIALQVLIKKVNREPPFGNFLLAYLPPVLACPTCFCVSKAV